MTDVQALKRNHPGLLIQPGKVERREFEYIRHGTLSFIFILDVALGRIVTTSSGLTRNEQDFANHIQLRVESEPLVRQWHLIIDNLNTHLSETLVRFVVAESDIAENLDIIGKSCILKLKATRAVFLSDPSQRIVFRYTPKYASWINQVEIWLSILVRKLLRRSNFTSTSDLKNKMLAFVDYYNQMMVKPFKMTYKGKPLAAR